jgi:hypothetical protein
LKTKGRSYKRRALFAAQGKKRLQEIDRSRVRAGAARGVEKVSSR